MEDIEEYQDVIDEAEDQMDEAQDIQDAQVDQMETYSEMKKQSDQFTWFWKVVRLLEARKIVKVGNLNRMEIGDHGISVRDAMNLADLGEIFHHKTFGDYWMDRAVVTSATSMSKNGWFMELSTIQKKIRERARKASDSPQKWRLFNRKRKVPTEETQ